jgi:hypothetical protein
MGKGHRAPKHQRAPHRRSSCSRAAAMLKAAGAPERLRLLECLREGEACVSGLAEHLGEAVTTTSNRLQLLAREGLVDANDAKTATSTTGSPTTTSNSSSTWPSPTRGTTTTDLRTISTDRPSLTDLH